MVANAARGRWGGGCRLLVGPALAGEIVRHCLEGLVCSFSGRGKLWVRTRAVNPLLAWAQPFRPQKKRK